MGVKEIRELLRLYNLEHSVVQNKNSGRYSIILHNNIIGTNVDGEKVVVFRTIPEGSNTFSTERNRFYEDFVEVFDDDKAIEAVRQYFENNRNDRV